jgi:hypothetical protein
MEISGNWLGEDRDGLLGREKDKDGMGGILMPFLLQLHS